MVGTARKWFTERFSELKTFKDFEVRFRDTFDFKLSKDEMLKKMEKRNQGKSEPVYSNFQDKVTLCQTLSYGYDEIKEHVIMGLHNKHIVTVLFTTKPIDSDELLHEIIRFKDDHGKRLPVTSDLINIDENETIENRQGIFDLNIEFQVCLFCPGLQ